jgi:hypothetical protein
MKYFAACFLVFFSGFTFASEDCSFNQDYQVEVVRNLSARYPGGSLDETAHRITWTMKGGGSVVFEFGGCAHLGSVITRSDPLAKKRTSKQVLGIARHLARKYWHWDMLAVQTMVTNLERSSFITEIIDDKTFYRIKDPTYTEFYIEHEYIDGTDRVTVAWMGNY